MLDKYNAKGKFILFLAFTALSGALILGFVLYQRHFNWPIDRISFDNMRAQRRVLEFLERAGWKPSSERVIVEKVGDDLGLARAVLLKKSNGRRFSTRCALSRGPPVYSSGQALRFTNR
jgi:hypothetical protein